MMSAFDGISSVMVLVTTHQPGTVHTSCSLTNLMQSRHHIIGQNCPFDAAI